MGFAIDALAYVTHICFTMLTASVREIRQSFGRLLKAVKNGETIAITSRRKIVATLGPPPAAKAKKRAWADLDGWLASQPVRTDRNLAALITEDRDDIR